MRRLRRALPRIAVTWLLCHAAMLTLGPVAFQLASAEELLECQCAHGDHVMCPMHHKPVPGSRFCAMQSTDDSSVAVFSWLWNVGFLPRTTPLIVPEPQQTSRPVDVTAAHIRPAPPDPPPPRA